MQFNPILERTTAPRENLWYALSVSEKRPGIRVGHTCTHVESPDSNGKLYIIGGANPSQTFAHVFTFDLDMFTWDMVDCDGFNARYEHTAFIAASQPRMIYVFGGADQNGNKSDLQAFDTETKIWNTVAVSGVGPSARTFHNGTSVGDKLIVYSGGQLGSEPVADRQTYTFDVTDLKWTVLNTRGDAPKPRHGHLMVSISNKVYLHGGMSGTSFFDDIHVLDLTQSAWRNLKQKSFRPPARAAHGGFVSGTNIYIFGGLTHSGALDDFYKFDTSK